MEGNDGVSLQSAGWRQGNRPRTGLDAVDDVREEHGDVLADRHVGDDLLDGVLLLLPARVGQFLPQLVRLACRSVRMPTPPTVSLTRPPRHEHAQPQRQRTLLGRAEELGVVRGARHALGDRRHRGHRHGDLCLAVSRRLRGSRTSECRAAGSDGRSGRWCALGSGLGGRGAAWRARGGQRARGVGRRRGGGGRFVAECNATVGRDNRPQLGGGVSANRKGRDAIWRSTIRGKYCFFVKASGSCSQQAASQNRVITTRICDVRFSLGCQLTQNKIKHAHR